MKLILASTSPRRADLLRQAGLDFRVVAPDISEKISASLTPAELVNKLALKKALNVARRLREGIVLGADTVVYHGGEIIGKPRDTEEAGQMLWRLQGERHEVLTGLVLIDAVSGCTESATAITAVWLKKLERKEIDAYIATGEPFDKAGAYGIQGRAGLFVERVEGCYFNVVGLPLGLLYDLLKNIKFSFQ